MMQFYSGRGLLPCLFTTFIFTVFSYAQSFNASGLIGENLVNPTSLDFGPNGKLYVAQQDGSILEYTVSRDNAEAGQGTYSVANTEVITVVKTETPNHNDDGTVNPANTRQITGLLATGTASTPVLYLSSSDSRHGGAFGGTDTNLDTNSGVLSRLVWTGSAWDKVDLVRGLPRCEENHSTNGMDIFERDGNTYLLLQQGGNANMGAPSHNFAGTSETNLSGALLVVNLTQLEQMEAANGGPFIDSRNGTTKYIYDLPTLNDPDRQDITNGHPNFPYPQGHPLYGATIDIGDPFGGNNGLNQAFAETGGPVQIFSPGFRNGYDVVITSDGRIYSSDNGPNKNWGGAPVIYDSAGNIKADQSTTNYDPSAGDYVTNDFENNGVTIGDALHYVGNVSDANGSYYAGHPVPIRAFPSRAGVKVYNLESGTWVVRADYGFGDLLNGVSGYFNSDFDLNDFPDNPLQGEYLVGVRSDSRMNILDIVSSSTNGITEYTASNFDGAMKGDLLTASYNGKINRYELNANGDGLNSKNNNFLTGFGSQPLDVIAQGDDDPFPGTIWAATYGADTIMVFEPADFENCLSPTDAGYVGTEDYDFDGFTNDDELANGTDICSGGSKPTDNDGDFISDLTDTDDDNDGIADTQDVFAIDAHNGKGTDLPIDYPFWNNDPGTGFFGLGFTGLMLDPSGNTDYLDQFDTDNLSFGGAGGKATIDAVGEGDARGSANTQQNAFQVGINMDAGSAPFSAHTRIETPFGGSIPVSGISYGLFIGNGDQDHYLKVALMEGVSNNDEVYGFEVVREDGPTNVSGQKYDVAGVLDAGSVDIYISVDPALNSAQPYYSIDGGDSVIALGSPVSLPAGLLDSNDHKGMAVGLISTSAGPGPEFTATWDFLEVKEDGDSDLVLSENPVDFGILQSGSGQVQLIPSLTNGGGPSAGTIQVTDIFITGANAALFGNSTGLPLTIGPGAEKTLPLNFYPDNSTGTKTADLVIEHTGENSPYTVSLKAILKKDLEPLYNVVARVNAGGRDVSATDGRLNWESNASEGAFNGIRYSVNTGKIPGAINTFAFENRHSSIPDYIDEATFDAIYQKERYDAPGGPEMEFQFPVPDGNYIVNIFTGNGYGPANDVGARQFDISLEDEPMGEDIDVVALFGGSGTDYHAGMLSYPVTVSDGTLNLLFEHGANENPVLQAIEILGVDEDSSPISVAPIADQVYQVNENSVLAVSATGGDSQENFLYAISGQPAGIDIEPTNGQIFGTISGEALSGGPNGDGVHPVTVTVSKPSSESVSIEFTWIVDNSGAPIAGINANPVEGEAPLRVFFSSSPSFDDEGIVGYLWEFGDSNASTSSEDDTSFTFTEAGTYHVTLTITDADGQSDTESVEIIVSQKPTHSIFASAGANGSISPEGQITVDEGTEQSFTISPDEGFKISDIQVDGILQNIEDSYIFENVVADHTLEVVFSEIVVKEAPIAVAVSDVSQSFAPLTVNFDGSDSTDDEGIVSYLWNFGDGSPEASGASVGHIYTEAGVFTARLTVADADGETATDTLSITVNVPRPAGGTSETENDLRLFPNPASVAINLGYGGDIDLTNIYIYSMQGQLMGAYDADSVRYRRGYIINVSALSAGLYFISAQDASGNELHKQMVIKR